MAFKFQYFKGLAFNYPDSPTAWSYSTSDTLAEVQASGYFSDPLLSLTAGDFIFCCASDGMQVLAVTDSSTASIQGDPTTGWATYVDTQYTVGSPFSISATTETNLPNNAGTKIESQMPADIATFYDGSVITGRNGDSLDAMIYFKATSSHVSQYLDIWIDIGGDIGEIYRQTFTFPKGSGAEMGIMYALPSAYTLGTWEANGGTVKCYSSHSLTAYGMTYNFDRSHKAV